MQDTYLSWYDVKNFLFKSINRFIMIVTTKDVDRIAFISRMMYEWVRNIEMSQSSK